MQGKAESTTSPPVMTAAASSPLFPPPLPEAKGDEGDESSAGFSLASGWMVIAFRQMGDSLLVTAAKVVHLSFLYHPLVHLSDRQAWRVSTSPVAVLPLHGGQG